MVETISTSGAIPADGLDYFHSVAARVAGSISVAHGLGRTPSIVFAIANTSAAGNCSVGTHDSTHLAINAASSGATYTLFAL